MKVTFVDILMVLLLFGAICSMVYILSRIQMRAWLHGLNKHLFNNYKLKKEDDERKEKE